MGNWLSEMGFLLVEGVDELVGFKALGLFLVDVLLDLYNNTALIILWSHNITISQLLLLIHH